MRNTFYKFCLATIYMLLVHTAYADSVTGWAAFNKGNFQQAFADCAGLAERNDASCQALLGSLYKNGNAVPQDNNLSLKWLNKSAENGNAIGQEVLGDTLLNGRNGVEKNIPRAYELFISASSKGNTYADNQLGYMNRFGIHVKQNLPEALRYLQSAAGKGNPAAQSSLADMYRLGDGVAKNPDQAFQKNLFS
jgi:TPR repeat protein